MFTTCDGVPCVVNEPVLAARFQGFRIGMHGGRIPN
jgi:hypothetical protein